MPKRNSLCPFTRGGRARARSGAKAGATIGASIGSRAGPVAAGIASGFGGAAGYIAGAMIDDVTPGDGRLLPDGGRELDAVDDRSDGADHAVSIPVTEADR